MTSCATNHYNTYSSFFSAKRAARSMGSSQTYWFSERIRNPVRIYATIIIILNVIVPKQYYTRREHSVIIGSRKLAGKELSVVLET